MVLQRIAVVLVAVMCLMSAGCATTGSAVRGTWTAVSSAPQPLVTESTITITFDGSSVTGSSGCNGYGSRSARVSNGTLIMGETASSAMACMGPPGLMEQEARFYALLNARPQIQVDGDTLLLTGQAITVTFRRS
jgi:heat shock protein HslJ